MKKDHIKLVKVFKELERETELLTNFGPRHFSCPSLVRSKEELYILETMCSKGLPTPLWGSWSSSGSQMSTPVSGSGRQ